MVNKLIVQLKSHFSMQLYKLIQNNITLSVCSVSKLLFYLLQSHVLLTDDDEKVCYATYRHQHFSTPVMEGGEVNKNGRKLYQIKGLHLFQKLFINFFYVCVSFKNEGSITQLYCS